MFGSTQKRDFLAFRKTISRGLRQRGRPVRTQHCAVFLGVSHSSDPTPEGSFDSFREEKKEAKRERDVKQKCQNWVRTTEILGLRPVTSTPFTVEVTGPLTPHILVLHLYCTDTLLVRRGSSNRRSSRVKSHVRKERSYKQERLNVWPPT